MTTASPENPHRIIVPVSNPATAPHLLKLATALIHPDEGKIIALYVALESVEDEGTPIEEIEPIIEQFVKANCPVELLTHPAGSVTRGILDVAREQRADLLILGVQNARKGQFEIGTVTRGVVAAAPCNVLVYAARRHATFEQVIVPVDGSKHAQAGARGCRMASTARRARFTSGWRRSRISTRCPTCWKCWRRCCGARTRPPVRVRRSRRSSLASRPPRVRRNPCRGFRARWQGAASRRSECNCGGDRPRRSA